MKYIIQVDLDFCTLWLIFPFINTMYLSVSLVLTGIFAGPPECLTFWWKLTKPFEGTGNYFHAYLTSKTW